MLLFTFFSPQYVVIKYKNCKQLAYEYFTKYRGTTSSRYIDDISADFTTPRAAFPGVPHSMCSTYTWHSPLRFLRPSASHATRRNIVPCRHLRGVPSKCSVVMNSCPLCRHRVKGGTNPFSSPGLGSPSLPRRYSVAARVLRSSRTDSDTSNWIPSRTAALWHSAGRSSTVDAVPDLNWTRY